jgi:beta-glucosidase
MTARQLDFPDGFLWGAATSSHQTEGNNTNNDFWAWEHLPGKVVDGSISGLANDWWNRAEEDFERAASINLNAFRLSIEWSRIEPDPGKWDDSAIERYREMLKFLRDRGIEPMITLHHFTNPLWLASIGGWTNPDAVNRFAQFADKAVDVFGDLCRMWGTINEINVYAVYSFALGKWTPGGTDMNKAFKVMRHMALAHGAAYRTIKQKQPDSEIGLIQHLADFHPVNKNSFFNRKVVDIRSAVFNWRVLDAVMQGKFKFPLSWTSVSNGLQGTNDFLGINYYGRHLTKFNPTAFGTLWAEESQAPVETAWPEPWTDREISADGFFKLIMETHNRYHTKIYITENGLADHHDTKRPAFILTHLAAIHKAIQQGANVRGFYYWTLVDNYEWVEGWTTPFGLIGLNPETQERTIRKSAEMLGEISKANAITEDIVNKYAPHAIGEVFG